MQNRDMEHIRKTVLEGGTKATVLHLDAEGNITKEESIFRGCFSLLAYLDRLEDKKERIKIVLKPEGVPPPNEKGEQPEAPEIVLAEGTVQEAMEHLQKKAMVPQHALVQLHLLLSRIMELSPLRGVIVTAVFEEGKGAGFSLLSETEPVEAEHIKTLGAIAASQVQQFKDHIKEAFPDIKFPDDADKDLIITPDQARQQGVNLRRIK